VHYEALIAATGAASGLHRLFKFSFTVAAALLLGSVSMLPLAERLTCQQCCCCNTEQQQPAAPAGAQFHCDVVWI
jgi:hypothetical protein